MSRLPVSHNNVFLASSDTVIDLLPSSRVRPGIMLGNESYCGGVWGMERSGSFAGESGRWGSCMVDSNMLASLRTRAASSLRLFDLLSSRYFWTSGSLSMRIDD